MMYISCKAYYKLTSSYPSKQSSKSAQLNPQNSNTSWKFVLQLGVGDLWLRLHIERIGQARFWEPQVMTSTSCNV